MDLTIRIQQKNGEYVASCPELDIHCFGPSKTKASNRLKNVIQFYFDSAQDIQIHAKADLALQQTTSPQNNESQNNESNVDIDVDVDINNNAFLH